MGTKVAYAIRGYGVENPSPNRRDNNAGVEKEKKKKVKSSEKTDMETQPCPEGLHAGYRL